MGGNKGIQISDRRVPVGVKTFKGNDYRTRTKRLWSVRVALFPPDLFCNRECDVNKM